MAGLTTATFLAQSGLPVTVLEQAAEVGGRAGTRDREGFAFNQGSHALYLGGAASHVLDELQVPYPGRSPDRAFVLAHGRLHRVPTSLPLLLWTGFIGPRDKLALARFFRALPALDARAASRMTIDEWIAATTKRPGVRRLLTALARTFAYSAALDQASAEVFIDRLQAAFRQPVRYIDGGWQTLAAGVRRAAEQAGVQIVTRARAETVEHEHGMVRGVRLAEGDLMPAAAVVLACGPRAASRLVDRGGHPALQSVARSLVAAEVACLDVALSRLPSARYPAVQDLEQPRFLSTQSLFARVAPPGGALIQVVKQLPAAPQSDPRSDEQELEKLLDRAQPGWRDLVVERVFLPRMEASSLLPTAAAGGYAGRPSHRVPGLANLYLAGDWVGPEGYLLDASMASARRTAELLREDLPVLLAGQDATLALSSELGAPSLAVPRDGRASVGR